jgi:hypothetical protein
VLCGPVEVEPRQPAIASGSRLDRTGDRGGAKYVSIVSPLVRHALATTPAKRKVCERSKVLPSQPSPKNWRIGFRGCSFGACSAFIHIIAVCRSVERGWRRKGEGALRASAKRSSGAWYRQVQNALVPACSPGRLGKVKPSRATFYDFDGFVASAAAPIATGRNVPVAGRGSHPLELHRLFTAYSFFTIRAPTSAPPYQRMGSFWRRARNRSEARAAVIARAPIRTRINGQAR